MTSADPIVAVVDDESPVRTTLGRILKMAAYRVAPFASGDDFLASMAGAAPQPDCAVVDIHMPGTSGLQVSSLLRGRSPRIPVVLITASDDETLQRTAREAGASCLLRKPFTSEELVHAVERALETHT